MCERVPDVLFLTIHDNELEMTRRSSRVQYIEQQSWPRPPGAELGVPGLRPAGARLEDGGNRVRCRYAEGSGHGPEDAFRRFLRLDSAPAVRVRDFVGHFGMLGFADDGLPGVPDEVPFEEPPFWGGHAEPVKWYRHYAGVAAATIRIAAYIREHRPPEVEDLKWLWLHWVLVNEGVAEDPGRWNTDAVSRGGWVAQLALSKELKQRLGLDDVELLEDEEDRPAVPRWLQPSGKFPPAPAAAVLSVVRWWLIKGETELALAWDYEREDFTWGWHGGLWSRLGRHLLYTVRGARGGSNCDGCGRFVRHQRAPKSGQQVWCHRLACRRIQQREAKQRSRKNPRERTAD